MTIILVSKDLLFITKIKEAASARGQTVTVARSADRVTEAIRGATDGSGVILIDAENAPVELDVLSPLVRDLPRESWRCLCFFSHVHHETGERARELGLGEVMPRSRFINLLPELFSSL